MNPAADIFEYLQESSEEYQHVLVGTHRFDPDFFEQKILPVLSSREAETILVLTGKSEYNDRLLEMRQAGKRYHIDYCHAGRMFHPEFILLIWSGGIRLVLGSANLTEESWFESGEITGSLEYYFSEPNTEDKKVLSDFREFLSKLANCIKGEKHRSELFRIIEGLPKSSRKTSSYQLVHNMERPILDQVIETVGGPVESVRIMAPSFDVEGSVLDFFERNGCKDIQVLVQPERVGGFPKQKIKEMLLQGRSITLNQAAFKEDRERFIHAKTVLIKTAKRSFCLYGSANPTRAGMLSTSKDGSLELCVLHSNSRSSYFDALIKDHLQIDPLDTSQIKEASAEPPAGPQPGTIGMTDAYIEERRLKIVLEPDLTLESAEIILAHHAGESLTIPCRTLEKTILHDLNQEQFDFCLKPTRVQISFQANDQKVQSEARWISMPNMELAPKRKDLASVKTCGRHGLITLLDKFSKFNQFANDPRLLYLLLQWYRPDSPDTLVLPARYSITESGIKDDREYPKSASISDRTLWQVIEKRSNELCKSIQRAHASDREELESHFDQFLTWSKIILWLFFQNKIRIENMRFIRTNMEELLKLHRKIRQKRLVSFLDRRNFWLHLVFLSYLMISFQRKAGFQQKNPGVFSTFAKTARDVIAGSKGKIALTEEESKHLEKEYSELGEIEIDLDRLSRFYEEHSS